MQRLLRWHWQGEDVDTTDVFPALGSTDQQPAAYSPDTGLFYVPGKHVWDYEPFYVDHIAGQPYVKDGTDNLGKFIAWDTTKGKIVWSIPEALSGWSGALATGGGVVFYGTLDGHLKAIDADTGGLLYSFKSPSGIIGNVNTWIHVAKQYIGTPSGVGGWAGVGMAGGLEGDLDSLPLRSFSSPWILEEELDSDGGINPYGHAPVSGRPWNPFPSPRPIG